MLITPLEQAADRRRSVAVGEFDGVHLGHREVISGSDTVLTFEPHPRAVIGSQGAPALLTTLEQKAKLVEELGVEEMIVVTFDQEFSQMTAEQFVDRVLVEQVRALKVSVGANFRFGNRAAGDPDTLRADSRFDTRVVDLVATADGPVSSSRIRDLIRDGDLETAKRLLGHNFEMVGNVVEGAKRGRELGYPTANVELNPALIAPADGIYACMANQLPAVASLGTRPTFETGGSRLLEVHLLDFKGDLYGQELHVEMLKRLRPELKFESGEELIAQMDQDSADAAAVCKAQAE